MTALRRMAVLSIAASILTLILKFGAYFLTGSVSLLSDAAESLVNLTAGLVAFAALTFAARPADASHAYGHDKAEYFSSGTEGGLILIAALSIMYAATERFMHPAPLSQLGLGLMISLTAAAVNYGVARVMLDVARQHDSIAVEADARHLMTDVWTSVGVVGGLLVVMFAPPGWQVLDPLMAVAVGLNIIRTGFDLLRRSWRGLMDESLPAGELDLIEAALREVLPPVATFHDLRTRKSGPRRFIECHVLLPGAVSVSRSHAVCDAIEAEIAAKLRNTSVTIHVEPMEDHPPV